MAQGARPHSHLLRRPLPVRCAPLPWPHHRLAGSTDQAQSGLPRLCRPPYLIEIDHRARTALAALRNGGSHRGRRTTTDMTGRASELP